MSTGNLLATSLSALSSYHHALRRMWLVSLLSIILLEMKSWISCIHRCDKCLNEYRKVFILTLHRNCINAGYSVLRCFYWLYFTLFFLSISLVNGGSAVNPNSCPHELQCGQGTQCFHKMTAIYSNSQHQLYYFGIVTFHGLLPHQEDNPFGFLLQRWFTYHRL